MLEEKGNTTTPHQVRGRLWQDKHSGLRRHKLMTKELGDNIPALGANEDVEDYDSVLAAATVFGSVPAVERDLYWEPQTLGEIRGQSRGRRAA